MNFERSWYPTCLPGVIIYNFEIEAVFIDIKCQKITNKLVMVPGELIHTSVISRVVDDVLSQIGSVDRAAS